MLVLCCYFTLTKVQLLEVGITSDTEHRIPVVVLTCFKSLMLNVWYILLFLEYVVKCHFIIQFSDFLILFFFDDCLRVSNCRRSSHCMALSHDSLQSFEFFFESCLLVYSIRSKLNLKSLNLTQVFLIEILRLLHSRLQGLDYFVLFDDGLLFPL